MSEQTITLPSKPIIISEDEFSGVYEINELYPGYGHTLGNSLRRIILSSLEGVAVTSVKIEGVSHEFSVIDGVKEDVINILLNLKKIRMKTTTLEPQVMTLKVKGVKEVKAGDINAPGQVEILNPELIIANLTDKNATLNMEITVEKGLGFVSRESLQKNSVDVGTIALDAAFTPIRRVNYEVENVRVGDRTDFNKLKISIETDGTISPKQALEKSIETMILQLKAIVGFKEEEIEKIEESKIKDENNEEDENDFSKIRIETIDLSTRTLNALAGANIKTIGGLARKKEKDLLETEGLGQKGVQEIKKLLSNYGVTLKQE